VLREGFSIKPLRVEDREEEEEEEEEEDTVCRARKGKSSSMAASRWAYTVRCCSFARCSNSVGCTSGLSTTSLASPEVTLTRLLLLLLLKILLLEEEPSTSEVVSNGTAGRPVQRASRSLWVSVFPSVLQRDVVLKGVNHPLLQSMTPPNNTDSMLYVPYLSPCVPSTTSAIAARRSEVV